MGSKVGLPKRGSVSTKTRKEIDEHEIELPPESLATSIADGTVQNVVKEDATSLPVSSSAVRITQDTVEPVKINKSTRKKGDKRKHQNDQVDVQSEEMLKLRAALQGKLRSNGVFGSTVSKSDKAQKRHKLAKRRKIELKVLAGAGVKSEEDRRNETEVFESQGSEDEFYKQVKQKKEAKRAAKAEIYSRESSSNLLLLPESVEGKRLISKEILSNRGLTRHRNKDKKNPRKNYRDKYTDKVKRRGGQVREIRKPSGPYGGEGLGINPNISHSIRIKN
ncbi:something about silencing protein 10 [Brassica napus]|uniref:something about silencing protein 10 n=1 Tax=Brassica napus TaxID=3708 RepID=UPI000BBE759A|nr:something about silencing protein 10 [Brassica napus]